MVIDLANGVYRAPQVSGSPQDTTIDGFNQGVASGASPSPNQLIATIPGNTQVYGVSISVKPQSRAGTATNPKFSVFVDNQLVALYQLPPVQTTDPAFWWVDEVIAFNSNKPGNSILRARLEADNGGVTGYVVDYQVSALGVST